MADSEERKPGIDGDAGAEYGAEYGGAGADGSPAEAAE